MTMAWWDLCQCGLVFLVSHRWLTVLQVSSQFLYYTRKEEEWEKNQKRTYALWAKFCNIGTSTFFPFVALTARPLLVNLTKLSNSSGITLVSGVTAALLTYLPTKPELCLWFSGVWCVFLTSSLPFDSSCTVTFAQVALIRYSNLTVACEYSHCWRNVGLQFNSHTQLDNHRRVCAACRHRYSCAHRRTPLLKWFILLPNCRREHLL